MNRRKEEITKYRKCPPSYTQSQVGDRSILKCSYIGSCVDRPLNLLPCYSQVLEPHHDDQLLEPHHDDQSEGVHVIMDGEHHDDQSEEVHIIMEGEHLDDQSEGVHIIMEGEHHDDQSECSMTV